MVADSLAKLATCLSEREMRDDLPDSVRELVLADAACIANLSYKVLFLKICISRIISVSKRSRGVCMLTTRVGTG
jgi:hypothetical protein